MSLIIDAGHQGKGIDPGAVGNGIVEADMVLDISLYQAERFKELNVPCKLTRTTDRRMTNKQRTDMVKASGAKHCISNHINAGGGDGAEVIHSIHANPDFAEKILDALHNAGQNKRRVFSKRLSNTSSHDYYYMHRDTGSVQTVIVEYGFLDSKGDDVIQLKRDWKLYAEAVVKAYCQFAGYKYVAPGGKVVEKPKEEVKKTTNEFKEAIDWAVKNKISNGKDMHLLASRQQVVTMLYRFYKLMKG